MIAMEIAGKMKMSLISVMQNLAVIKGKPGWLGSFVISLVNACGRFKPLHFVWFHNDKKDPNKITGCCAQAVEIESGELIVGSPITEETVRGFGWDKKDNSMWNIPGQREQMFQYRAAAYFARAKCPEVLNGLYTKEELMDIENDYSGAEKVTINLGGNK